MSVNVISVSSAQPDNLLIDAKGLLRITDFGLSHDGLHMRRKAKVPPEYASNSQSYMVGDPPLADPPVVSPEAADAALEASGVARARTPPSINTRAGGTLALLSSGWKALQERIGISSVFAAEPEKEDESRVRLFSGVGGCFYAQTIKRPSLIAAILQLTPHVLIVAGTHQVRL